MTAKIKYNDLMSALTAVLHDYQILFASTTEDSYEEMFNDAVAELYDILDLHTQKEVGGHPDGLWLRTDTDLEMTFAIELLNMFELWKKKHHDYGSKNISVFGERGIFVRMYDKIQRLMQLVWHGKSTANIDERVYDTYRDLAVYAIIAILVRNMEWPE